MSSKSMTSAALVAGAILCFHLSAVPSSAQTADYLYWTVVIEGEVWRSEASGDYKEQLVEPVALG